ncbi:hypothetical protein NL676_023104 [Syzygium grande]|nr:hypothetical protein NL676_023104 [Syzygium grande]
MGDYNDAMMRNQNAAVQARTKAQSRANVLQLKLIGQSHPTGLTANLLKLFEPRPPLEYKPPPEKRKCPPYAGIGQFVSHFAEPGDPEYAPPVQKAETPVERRARIHNLRLEKGAEKAAEELKQYDPNNDPNISGDPYKTLFVAKLSYETSESKLKREFESYGPIKRVRLVQDTVSQKPKGYAFIEYLHTRDMKAAYKQADGRKIDGRRLEVKMLVRGRLGGSNHHLEDHLDRRNQGRERIDMRGRSLGKGEETKRENVKSPVSSLMIGQEIVIAEKIGTTGTVAVTGIGMEREIAAVTVTVTVVAITVIETVNAIVTVTVTVVIALVRGIEKGIGKGNMKLTVIGTVAVLMIRKQTMIALNQSMIGTGMQGGSETMIVLKPRVIKYITDIRSMGTGRWRLTATTSPMITMSSTMESGVAMTTLVTVVVMLIIPRMLITMIRWKRTTITTITVPVETVIGSKDGEFIFAGLTRMCALLPLLL